MDFTPNPEQQAVADVVTSVLDRDNTWEALVSGGVAALGVPDRLDGTGATLSMPSSSRALAWKRLSVWSSPWWLWLRANTQ